MGGGGGGYSKVRLANQINYSDDVTFAWMVGISFATDMRLAISGGSRIWKGGFHAQ